MRLGDLLVSAKIVSQADVDRAMERQQEEGGRLGDLLVSMGAVSHEALDAFLQRIPQEPESIAETGIPANELLALMIKHIQASRLETLPEFVEALKLAPRIVEHLVQEAVARGLIPARLGAG